MKKLNDLLLDENKLRRGIYIIFKTNQSNIPSSILIKNNKLVLVTSSIIQPITLANECLAKGRDEILTFLVKALSINVNNITDYEEFKSSSKIELLTELSNRGKSLEFNFFVNNNESLQLDTLLQ